MSSRGLVPLLIATAFGIANGVYVFAPAFKEQKEAEKAPLKESLEAVNTTAQEKTEMESVIAAEAAASRKSVNDVTLKPKSSSNSWWPKTSLWLGGGWENESSQKPIIPSIEARKNSEDGES